jgi:hypothetical protein
MSLKLGAWLVLAASLVRCVPDFDSLSSGAGDGGGVAGQASGGTAMNAGGSSAGSAGDAGDFGDAASGGVGTSAGGSSAGSAGDGDRGGSTNEGGQTQSAGGNTEPVGGVPGAGATGEGAAAGDPAMAAGGEGASGGQGGATGGEGGTPSEPCEFMHPGATHFNGFDGGLVGSGFTSATTTVAVVTTLGTTGTSEWDPTAGKSCPGALHMEAQFKGYASGTASNETAIVDLRFSQANWVGAVELRGWIKVEPATAPLANVRFFVLSGNSFLYDSVYDETKFRSGLWNEMIVPLTPGLNFDPARVLRIGVEIMLQRQGEGANPALATPIHVWLDDVWVK